MAMVGMNAWAQTNLLAADNISVSAKQSGSEITQSLSEGTLTLTVAASELTLKLDFDAVDIDASNCYVILETSTGILNTGGTFKTRNIKVDGNTFDYGSGGDKSTTTYNSHQIVMTNPMGNNNGTVGGVANTQLLSYYADNIDKTMELSSIGFNIPISTAGTLTIYRIGLYNIAEIEGLYGNPAMRLKNNLTQKLFFEFNGTANQISVNSNTITLTQDEALVLIKSLGTLPNTFTLVNLRGLTLSDDSPVPFMKETMRNLANVTKVLFGTDTYKYFPTVNANVGVLGNRYYQYKDGTIPTTSGTYNIADGSNTNRYMSYTRQFIAGYSTMMVPFEVNISDLTALGLTAYTFSNATAGGEITFTKATGTIAHSTPMIIKAETAGLYLIPRGDVDNTLPGETNYKNNDYIATDDINNVKFVGSYRVNDVPDGSYASTNNYGITSSGTKFAKMGATTKTAYYRAFLASSNISFAPTLFFNNGDGTTDIKRIEDVDGMERFGDGAIYNLQGVRMNADNLPRGIYVRNGKKFVVK